MSLITIFWRLVATLIFLCLAACATPKMSQDYLEAVDFSRYNTYTWRKLTNEVVHLDDALLQQLTNEQWQKQGLKPEPTAGDLWLDMTLLVQAHRGGKLGVGVGISLPIGRSGSIGVGGSQLGDREKMRGLLLVDLTDSISNQLIWRGSADKIPLTQLDNQNPEALQRLLAELLSQFPPNEQP